MDTYIICCFCSDRECAVEELSQDRQYLYYLHASAKVCWRLLSDKECTADFIPVLKGAMPLQSRNMISWFHATFHTNRLKALLLWDWLTFNRSLAQCPRTDLNKRFLPTPKTTTAWKLIPHRSKFSKNWNLPRWVPLHRFFKNRFLLIQKQLYNNYIQTHFT